MELSLLRILLDFGLVVLIWMVQLLVYPGFLYFSKEGLLEWHKKYTQGMFIIVMPLMVGELLVAGIQLFYAVTFFTVCYAAIVFALWGITFVWFVPLHGKIADGKYDTSTLQQLAVRNWVRTALWMVLFVVSLLQYLQGN